MLWVILGIIIGCVLFYLISGVKAQKIKVSWYQWVLGVISVCMLLFTIQNYLAFTQRELEPHAGSFILLALGLPAVILGALIWLIPLIIRTVGKSAQKEAKA